PCVMHWPPRTARSIQCPSTNTGAKPATASPATSSATCLRAPVVGKPVAPSPRLRARATHPYDIHSHIPYPPLMRTRRTTTAAPTTARPPHPLTFDCAPAHAIKRNQPNQTPEATAAPSTTPPRLNPSQIAKTQRPI